MDNSAIVAQFGAYYINNGQNMSRIYHLIHAASKTEELATPILTDDTRWRASQALMSRVLQPFQKAWTPLDPLSFLPVEIQLFKQKIDIDEFPHDLEASFHGFLTGKDIDPKDWPFVRWYLEVHLLPKAKEDFELNEVYHGVYAAPTPGTAGAVSTSMDGIKKIINNHIVSGRITPITTGALATDPVAFCEQIEEFVDAIDPRYRKTPMQLAMNESNELLFHRGYKKKYGTTMDYRENTKGRVDLTAVSVVGLPSMDGSDKIWSTPKDNFIMLGKKTANMDAVKIESVKRTLNFYSDWWRGIGFIIPEKVFTNNLEL